MRTLIMKGKNNQATGWSLRSLPFSLFRFRTIGGNIATNGGGGVRMKRFILAAVLMGGMIFPAGTGATSIETYRTILLQNDILMRLHISTMAASLHFAAKKYPFYCPPKGKRLSSKTVRSIIEAVLKNDLKANKIDPKTPVEAIVVDVLSKKLPCPK